MSKSWICPICGTTAYSKCPSQRSIFPNDTETSIMRSVYSFDVIRDNRGTAEVVITATLGTRDNTDAKMVLHAVNYLVEKPEILPNLLCDHEWVLNSDTETACSLGCTHSNIANYLPDPDYAEQHKKRPMDKILRHFGSVINMLLERARITVNVTKTAYDTIVETGFSDLKQDVYNALSTLADGNSLRAKYEVRVRTDHPWKSNCVKFNTKEDAYTFMQGLDIEEKQYDVYVLGATGENYELLEWRPGYDCMICKKNIPLEEGRVLSSGGYVHTKCFKKFTDDRKCKLRTFIWESPREIKDDVYGSDPRGYNSLFDNTQRLLDDMDHCLHEVVYYASTKYGTYKYRLTVEGTVTTVAKCLATLNKKK
jgi:hypothetical protein